MEIRPYQQFDVDAFWELKRGFELGLGEGTGSDEKHEIYEAKLDDDYRERYLSWVADCLEENPRSVTVAVPAESEDTDQDVADELAGYVFVLPSSLAMIWDAAVLNEIYVRPEFRGTGVADDLMTAAIEIAREQDLPLSRIVLDVDRENERARAFYDRHGFDHWGEMVAKSL